MFNDFDVLEAKLKTLGYQLVPELVKINSGDYVIKMMVIETGHPAMFFHKVSDLMQYLQDENGRRWMLESGLKDVTKA